MSLRVLHVIASVHPSRGGPSTAIREILRMMAGSGIESSVLIGAAYRGEDAAIDSLRPWTNRISVFKRGRPDFFGFTMAYTREAGALIAEADVVHLHSMWDWPLYHAIRVATAMGVPVIIRPAGALDRFDVRKHAMAKRVIGPVFLRRLFSTPNGFHCTTRQEARHLVDYGGNAPREILALPVPEPAAGHGERERMRARRGIPADARVVLFMSRFNYKKGLELLLPALARLKVVCPDLHFILAGDGEPEIKRIVDELTQAHGLGSWTHRIGFVSGNEKMQALAASDVFVLPSQNENFGISVVEALAAGLPAVVCPGVYLADELPASPALAVAERTVAGVTDTLEKMLARLAADRLTLRAIAQRLWRDNFAPAFLRGSYEELYRRTAHRTL